MKLYDGDGSGVEDIDGEGFMNARSDGVGVLAIGDFAGIGTEILRGVTNLSFLTAIQATISFRLVGISPTGLYAV